MARLPMLASVVAILLAGLGGAAGPAAAESALVAIVPRLDRQGFGMLVERLELQSEQRLIAELAFVDYVAAIDELATQADAEADRIGRRRLQDALAGRVRLAPDELRRIQVGVWRAHQRMWPRSDELLQGLLDAMGGLLADEQRPAAGPAMMDLRRRLWLAPRRAGAAMPEYAGDGVDVADLLAAALAPGGELEAIDRAAITPALDEYVVRIDALLREDAAAERAGALERRIARMQADVETARRLEREAVVRWRRLYTVNEQAVAAIAGTAAARLGEEAARRWRLRWRRACFPWLHRDQRPDRLHAWMRTEALGVAQRERADAAYRDYAVRREALIGSTIELVLQGRLQLERLVTPTSTGSELEGPGGAELHGALLKRSGEWQALLDSATAALEAVLTPEQRRRAP
ncbi:MAG: hypothetical protein ACYTJ0_13290 [Planctomycetota bacterium]|jgi:hypothetical protein